MSAPKHLADPWVRQIEQALPTNVAVFAPARPAHWTDVEMELGHAFRFTQAVMLSGGVALFFLRADAVLGLGSALDSTLCGALLGGMRTLAMEGGSRGVRAHVVCFDPKAPVASPARLDSLLGDQLNGCVLHLDESHLGRMPA